MILLRSRCLFAAAASLCACSESLAEFDVLADAQLSMDAGGIELNGIDATTPAKDGGAVARIAPDARPPFHALDASAAWLASNCPPVPQRPVVEVPPGVLTENLTHWTCDNIYLLTGIVFVHGQSASAPQVLTVDPGTLIRGQAAPSTRGFLVVTRSGRIEAEGTLQDPIVFTSSNPPGSRAREDWGGVTLLGGASTGGTRRVEGLPATVSGVDLDPLLAYGPMAAGNSSGAVGDDAHSCGTLRYVRVEFASYNAGGGMGNESNAVQAYACGWNTRIDYLQTHLSGDDGVEIFGGTLDLRHLVITGASDDSIDWDDGWQGRAQFVVAQQHSDAADLGFEAGGSGDSPGLPPNPRMFNVTLVGTNGAATGKVGGRLRGGGLGYLRNFVILGFTSGALDIGGATAAKAFRAGSLSVQHSLFFRAGAATTFPLGAEDTPDDASSDPRSPDLVDEAVELTAPALRNQIADPTLRDPFNTGSPSFVPLPGAPLGPRFAERPSDVPGEARPPLFDPSAHYVGALAPGEADWMAGWTAFPAN